MEELVKALHAGIREEVQRAVAEMLEPLEMFSDLPSVSTTQELAKCLRVSDDIVRRMADEGMPHIHAGRELRFVKTLITEWSVAGKKYSCEICGEKSGNPPPRVAAKVLEFEPPQPLPLNPKIMPLKSKTKMRLAEFAAK